MASASNHTLNSIFGRTDDAWNRTLLVLQLQIQNPARAGHRFAVAAYDSLSAPVRLIPLCRSANTHSLIYPPLKTRCKVDDSDLVLILATNSPNRCVCAVKADRQRARRMQVKAKAKGMEM